MLQALLAAKADPNKPVGLPHEYDLTPLQLAAALCRPGAVSQLLAAGADPSATLVKRSSSKPIRPPDGRPSDYGDQQAAATAAVLAAATATSSNRARSQQQHNQHQHQHHNPPPPDPHGGGLQAPPLIDANLGSAAEGDTPLHTAVRQALEPDLVPLVLRQVAERGLVSRADVQEAVGELARQRLGGAFAALEALLDASGAATATATAGATAGAAGPGSSSNSGHSSGGGGGASSRDSQHHQQQQQQQQHRRQPPSAVHKANAAGATPLGLALAEPQDSARNCVALLASHPALDLVGTDVVLRAVGQRSRLPHAHLLLAAVQERAGAAAAAAAGGGGAGGVAAAAQRLLAAALSLYCGDRELVQSQTLEQARMALSVARSSARMAADRGWAGGRRPRLQQLQLQLQLQVRSTVAPQPPAPQPAPQGPAASGAGQSPQRQAQPAQAPQSPQQPAAAAADGSSTPQPSPATLAAAAAAAAAAGEAAVATAAAQPSQQPAAQGDDGGSRQLPPLPPLPPPPPGAVAVRLLRKTLVMAGVGLLARGLLGRRSTLRVALVMATAGVLTDGLWRGGGDVGGQRDAAGRQRAVGRQRQGAGPGATGAGAAAAAADGGDAGGLGGECCVCMSTKAVLGFVHGGVVHNCICASCMREMEQRYGSGAGSRSRRCPICKAHAQAVVRVVST
ncbi:hypothetical protein HYH02_013533 [Chlamydomonas schloesseri]|nr:hypothetical protein HYH02_013533 [Chlamydomonas schloesseri]|eukprot:KAG2431003.1 hypothetical protein HYH02_013533 [Chlamydomonas schloesseri]